MNISSDNKIAIFQKKEVRRTEHSAEWWFSVVDVVEVLTDSKNPRDYWFKMKIRVNDEDGLQLSTICRQLKLESSDWARINGKRKERNINAWLEFPVLADQRGVSPEQYPDLDLEIEK